LGYIEVDGKKIVAWASYAPDDELKLLFGVEYSDEDDIWNIHLATNEYMEVSTESKPKRLNKVLSFFQDGTFFIPDDKALQFKELIDACSTPDDKAREIIRNNGFFATEIQGVNSALLLAKALNGWTVSNKIPDPEDWDEIYKLFNDESVSASQKKIASKLFLGWLYVWEKSIGGRCDLYHRACISALLRHAGLRKKALELSECLYLARSEVIGSPDVLCTTRAATIMDYADLEKDPEKLKEYLKEARKLLNKANAISGGKSEHVMMAYIRLKQLDTKL
jgi:hypothetical protein